jgi:hypothetical protein
VVLLLAPQLPLRLFGLEEVGLAWLRILAMVVLILTYYYVNLARQGNVALWRSGSPAWTPFCCCLVWEMAWGLRGQRCA